MRSVLVAGGLALAVASMASAAELKLSFGSGQYAGGDSAIITLNNIEGTLTGFSLDFDFDPQQSGASWASDAGFVCNSVQTGGFDIYLSTATSFNAFWGFDGSGSASAGHYSDFKDLADVFIAGNSYSFEFGNAWSGSGPVAYNNVTITLFGVSEVPAPGAMALLGLAGIIGRRRRA